MSKLEIQFAWSESRVKTLRECARKYYINYFLSWEGWIGNASQEKKQAYRLKNLTTFPMFVGTVVHTVIEDAIKEFRRTDKWPSLSDSQEEVVRLLRKGWKESSNKEWMKEAKKTNFFEHYYNEIPPKKKLEDYKFKALRCISAFYKCYIFDLMSSLNDDDWIEAEEFQKFFLKDGEEVSVKLDCAFRHDGKVYIIDWKTGKPNKDIVDQVVTYSMYAIKKGWVKDVSDIIIIPVFLSSFDDDPTASLPILEITQKQITRQVTIIKKEYPILVDAFGHKDDEDYFEKTPNTNRCRYCSFKEICFPNGIK
jgi:CRISPR/Cas system-associated exonuclease Cas4 (RecB family)